MVLSAVGESFTMSGNLPLTSVKFYMLRYGSPIGTLVCRLYNGVLDENGRIKPDDDPVNSSILATSDTKSIGSISTLYKWSEFEFSGLQQYSLVDGNVYVIQLIILDATTLDTNNNIHVWGTLSNVCCEGDESGYSNSAWTSYAYNVSMIVYSGETVVYTCDQGGCGSGYGYDTLRDTFPGIDPVMIKSLPQLGIYGLDSTNELQLKSKVDVNGVLQTS